MLCSVKKLSLVLNVFLLVTLVSNVAAFPNNAKDDSKPLTTKSNTATWHSQASISELRQLQSNTMKSYMNLSVDPCDDFYEFSCGHWPDFHPIPRIKYENDVLGILQQNSLESVIELLLEPIPTDSNSMDKKLTDMNAGDKSKLYYNSCLDMDTINKRGTEPLLNLIHSLGGCPLLDDNWNEENFDFIEISAKMSKLDIKHLLNTLVMKDLIGNNGYAIYLSPVQYSIKDTTYYFNVNYSSKLNAFKTMIKEIFVLFGARADTATKTANEIINFEKNLQIVTQDLGSKESLHELYVASTIGDLPKGYDGVNLTRYLNLVYNNEFQSDKYVVLYGIPNLHKRIEFLKNTDKKLLANYLIFRTILENIVFLGDQFLDLVLNLFKLLNVPMEIPNRQKLCLIDTREKFGLAVSSLYIKKYFNEASKLDTYKITQEIKTELANTFKNSDWIDDETKQNAQDKANAINALIGYPDFIGSQQEINKYYESLNIKKGVYFENNLEHTRFKLANEFNLLDTPLNNHSDKSNWHLLPIDGNAAYGKHINAILIPAAILQPPIYHQNYPKALNYGGVGYLVGHEITHGFDSNGRQFDINGQIKNWWTQESIEKFNTRSNCFVDQYNKLFLNFPYLSGERSLTENIADNGGIMQAFKVYKNWLDNATPEEVKNESLPDLEFEKEQLFFLGFSQTMCGTISQHAKKYVFQTEKHSPREFRVNVPLANMEEFSKAYNCPVTSRMNPVDKCSLW